MKRRTIPSLLAALAVALLLSIPATAQNLHDTVEHRYGDRTIGARFTSYVSGQGGLPGDPLAVRQSQKTLGWNLGQPEEYTCVTTLCTYNGNEGFSSIGLRLSGHVVFQQGTPRSPLGPHQVSTFGGWFALRPVRQRLWGSVEIRSRSLVRYQHESRTGVCSPGFPITKSETQTRVSLIIQARTIGRRKHKILFTGRHEILNSFHRSQLLAVSQVIGHQRVSLSPESLDLVIPISSTHRLNPFSATLSRWTFHGLEDMRTYPN